MRILLTGNIFHDYEYDFYDALKELGHEVDMIFNNIHGPFHPRYLPSVPNWVKYGFLPHKAKITWFFDRSVRLYNEQLSRMLSSKTYDLLLVIGGKTISPQVLASFPGRKVLWFLDSLTRYEDVMQKVPGFDHIFLFEPTDSEVVKKRFNKEAKFLATGFSPLIHLKTDSPKIFDCSFIGSFYPKRDLYLGNLEGITDNLAIYGDFFRANSAYVKSKVKHFHIKRKDCNKLYNQSRINFNIHHDQSKEGLSPRTFEILGSGGFQMVERQKVAVEYFRENVDICFYESVEEFKEKAAYYLKHDSEREKIAASGYETVRKYHTWKSRFEEMFRQF